ncbi:glycosyltransferase family 4 protein [Hymenobacter sp. B81]|uniref:glycosyltransferase family 4 protein n=1 Tax=Hymenobacter sp. B81 TaxID=3344878 RepID=UPI0037DCB451
MFDAATPAVLLLGWDEAPAALPPARVLAQARAARVQLWVPAPLRPGAAPAAVTVALLDGDFEARVRPRPARAAALPASPYLGASPPHAAPRSPAVPAAPYLGASAAGPPAAARFEPAPVAGAAALPAPPPGLAQSPGWSGEPKASEAAALSSGTPLAEDDALPVRPDEGAPAAESADWVAGPEFGADSAIDSNEPAAESATEAEADDALDSAEAAAPAESADAPGQLNFRIIQYARHAVHRAVGAPFDVIVATEWPTWLAAVEIRQLTRRPLVVYFDFSPREQAAPADRGWVAELERLVLRHADVLLVPDEALARQLSARYQLPAGRFRVRGAGADPDLTAALVLDARLS